MTNGGAEPGCAAAALNERGLRFKASGRFGDARRCYARALQLLRLESPPDHDALAAVHHNLGGIDFAIGAYASGEIVARKGITLRLQGPAQPEAVAADLIALAALVDAQGRFDEGERLYVAGLGLLRSAPDRNRTDIAVALNGLGVQYARRGHVRAAARLLSQSLALKRADHAPVHPSVLLTQRNLEKVEMAR
jgi:tetratricopeptide (TPR) repeat protein